MAIYLEIKTPESVHQFILNFMNKTEIDIEGEFDSVNYGEGYDFKVKKVPCRLYDETINFNIEITNDHEHCVNIEIDKFNRFSQESQTECSVIIKQNITQSNIIEEIY